MIYIIESVSDPKKWVVGSPSNGLWTLFRERASLFNQYQRHTFALPAGGCWIFVDEGIQESVKAQSGASGVSSGSLKTSEHVSAESKRDAALEFIDYLAKSGAGPDVMWEQMRLGARLWAAELGAKENLPELMAANDALLEKL